MYDESKFKTLRHIETVRNFLNIFLKEIINRQELHDQTKLQEPEVSIFDIYTAKLRNCEYNSLEYKEYLKEMKVALDHHYSNNRHHPEHFDNGINGMNLVDIIEMFCDWYAATLRHNTGDIIKSIDSNRDRFNMDDQICNIFKNTVELFQSKNVKHYANES